MADQMPEGMKSDVFSDVFKQILFCSAPVFMTLWLVILPLRKTFKVDDMLQTVERMKGEQDSLR